MRRRIPPRAFALHVGSVLAADRNWNRVGMCGSLYPALTREGAIEEWRRTLAWIDERPKTRDLVSISVVVEPVIGLTDPAASTVPPDTPFLTGNSEPDLEQCRDLADSLRASGYVGILVPAAAHPGGKDLIIYIDGPASSVSLEDDGDRISVNLTPNPQ